MIRYRDNYKEKGHRKTAKMYASFPGDIWIRIYAYREKVEIIHEVKTWNKKYLRWDEKQARHAFKTGSREEIRSVINRTQKLFRYQHEWANFRKDLLSDIFRPESKGWEDVIPDKINIWAARKLQELKDKHGDNCTDNYRVALLGNSPQERRYRRQVKRGCCGFFDCTEICPIDGKVYRLGFNYGH